MSASLNDIIISDNIHINFNNALSKIFTKFLTFFKILLYKLNVK